MYSYTDFPNLTRFSSADVRNEARRIHDIKLWRFSSESKQAGVIRELRPGRSLKQENQHATHHIHCGCLEVLEFFVRHY